MIYLKISDTEFYDDAHILIKSFYPRTEVTKISETSEASAEQGIPEASADAAKDMDMLIEVQTPVIDGRDRRELHDDFKEKFYLQLVEMTGRTLPWGNILGVRPSKAVVNKLQNGVDEEEIRKLYREKYFVSEEKIDLAFKVAKKELQLLEKLDFMKGYSLYIGIPFCPTTCLYCSFTSYSLSVWKKEVDNYIDALIKEMEFVAQSMKGRRLDTIYFGGGTPTTLSPEQLDRVLSALEQNFNTADVFELTVEAGRPDSITEEKLQVLRNHGVGRISINPQTMNQATLDLIGRRHTVEQVVEAFELARKYGFDNINMDLILGLPGEDEEMVKNTLEQVSRLAPDSLTVHSLAIKRAAAINIWKEKYQDMQLINNDEIIRMTADYAEKLGLEPYYMYRQKNITGNFENVGYSVPGKECIYNVLIMEEKQTIIAIGAGASSKILFYSPDGNYDRIERIENVKDVRNYIDRIDEMIDRKRRFFAENEF